MTSENIKNHLGSEFCNILPTKGLAELYQRISYEIAKFLKDDKDRILFLQWPTEELSNNETKAQQYWKDLMVAVGITARTFLRHINPQEFFTGVEQYKGDNFLMVSDESTIYHLIITQENRIIVCKKQRTIQPYGRLRDPFASNDNNIPATYLPVITTRTEKETILKSLKEIYKTTDFIIERIDYRWVARGNYNPWLDRSKNEIKILNLRPQEYQKYKNAAFYGSNMDLNAQEKALIGENIEPIVKLHNTNSENTRADIVIIYGDNQFERIDYYINSLGPVKKLIIIGSVPTDYLLQQEHQSVKFSFQEACAYCGGKFYKPEFIELDFPWLRETLQSLHSVLSELHRDEGVSLDILRHIFHIAKKFLGYIDFSKDKLPSLKDDLHNTIENNYGDTLSYEVLERLDTWISDLNYDDSSNPKSEYFNNYRCGNRMKVKFSPAYKPKRQLNALGGRSRNHIIIDLPFSINPGLETITNICRYHLFDHIVGLYYKDIPDFYGSMPSYKDLMEKSLKRNPLFKDIYTPDDEAETDDRKFTLEDFVYDDKEYYDKGFYRIYDTPKPVEFTDGTNAVITGNILLHDRENLIKLRFQDLEDDYSGKIITYYDNSDPELFESFVRKHLRLPEGRDIQNYVTLWHDILKDYVETLDEDELDNFCRNLGITRNVLNNHLNDVSNFMRPRALTKFLNQMRSIGRISEEDRINVLKARQLMKSEHQSFGSELKDALLDYYRLNGECQLPEAVLRVIEDADLDINEIITKFIKTNTLK